MPDTARRIKLNYRKVNINDLADWLEVNNYEYALVPYYGYPTIIGSRTMWVEVYTNEAETAIRLKWNTE